ncbi:hypothetical protein LEP1GSC043_2514 [Leptospira weilii str. Ecochallenge]|uniref:Uncharacterized protein n=1 Tax=Leptospira weilii str. Ecochallenge TaxID=1049986 RepID=N1U2D6_9LEPT|nr:hypothetical protein LEP1GSC043_2514 [Leptospira weilii str. Ecochallenge]
MSVRKTLVAERKLGKRFKIAFGNLGFKNSARYKIEKISEFVSKTFTRFCEIVTFLIRTIWKKTS